MGISQIACPSATECVAAGYFLDSAGNGQGLLLTGYGSSWTAAQPQPPTGPSWVDLNAVSCLSVSSCVAGGQYYVLPAGNYRGLLVTGAGSSWIATDAPLPSGSVATSVHVDAVACSPAAAQCAAAADGYSAGYYPIMLTGLGSTWTAVRPSLPLGVGEETPALRSMTCASATQCVSGGEYLGPTTWSPMLVSGFGSSWTAVQSPVPSGTGQMWDQVACPSASACLAVSQYTSAWGASGVALVTGQGTAWTAAAAPLPANALNIFGLPLVACMSSVSCVAITSYTDASGAIQGLQLTGPA